MPFRACAIWRFTTTNPRGLKNLREIRKDHPTEFLHRFRHHWTKPTHQKPIPRLLFCPRIISLRFAVSFRCAVVLFKSAGQIQTQTKLNHPVERNPKRGYLRGTSPSILGLPMSITPRPPAISVGPYRVGTGAPLLLIAGPCVIESEALCLRIAEEVAVAAAKFGVQYVFKASFDKANRTSGTAFRGAGLDEGLRVLETVHKQTGLPVTTDIHESNQAAPAAEVCEILQIPAFLCRQTDLLLAAAATGRTVHVKKGQFLAPWDMKNVVEKLRKAGCQSVMLCERGTFFGYGRLINDFRALPQMRSLGVPVVFDATHSVQEPGGLGAATGGNRAMVEPLARAAVSVGVDGLFFETHPDPDRSPSDGPNMVPLDQFPALLERIVKLRNAAEALFQ